MHLATAVVLVVTATANIAIAVADVARAPFVLANSAEVHVPASWLPGLAALKAAGAVGLVLWFADVAVLPLAAAAGLTCFFVGAITVHVRARVLHNIAFPGTFLALAVACLTLLLLEPHP